MTAAWTWARAHPSAVLLYTQLLGILLYPFLEGPGDELGTLALSVFGGAGAAPGGAWPLEPRDRGAAGRERPDR